MSMSEECVWCWCFVAVQGGGAHGLSGTVVVDEHE